LLCFLLCWDFLRRSMLLFLTGCGLLGELADKPIIATLPTSLPCTSAPDSTRLRRMHRPVDYCERATIVFYSCCDAVIAIEPSDSTARA